MFVVYSHLLAHAGAGESHGSHLFYVGRSKTSKWCCCQLKYHRANFTLYILKHK